jgi:hypothetical protein
VKFEQPGLCEERIGPAKMVRKRQSHTGTPPRLFMQHSAQPPPYELIEPTKGAGVRVLEVGVPALQKRVEISDDARERLPARSPRL